jgi:hypothetical protein
VGLEKSHFFPRYHVGSWKTIYWYWSRRFQHSSMPSPQVSFWFPPLSRRTNLNQDQFLLLPRGDRQSPISLDRLTSGRYGRKCHIYRRGLDRGHRFRPLIGIAEGVIRQSVLLTWEEGGSGG